MEERGEGSKLPESGVPQEQRRLYSGASKIDRLTQHTLELKDDLMAWVDLKIKSVKLELQEKLDEQKKTIAIFGVVAVLGIYGLTFLLVTIALFIGWALGHPAWGFLIVTVVLLGLAGLLYSMRSRLAQSADKKMNVATKSLSHRVNGDSNRDEQ